MCVIGWPWLWCVLEAIGQHGLGYAGIRRIGLRTEVVPLHAPVAGAVLPGPDAMEPLHLSSGPASQEQIVGRWQIGFPASLLGEPSMGRPHEPPVLVPGVRGGRQERTDGDPERQSRGSLAHDAGHGFADLGLVRSARRALRHHRENAVGFALLVTRKRSASFKEFSQRVRRNWSSGLSGTGVPVLRGKGGTVVPVMTGTGVPVFEDRSIPIRPIETSRLDIEMPLGVEDLEQLSDLTIGHTGHLAEGGLAGPGIAGFAVQVARDAERDRENCGAQLTIVLHLLQPRELLGGETVRHEQVAP